MLQFSLNTLLLFALFVGTQSCKKEKVEIENHLKYFGFTLIDVGWDDPTDTITKTNYTNEVASFSNTGDILAVEPTDNIENRIVLMSQSGLKPIIHVSELFFYYQGVSGLSGSNYDIRPDYKERWNQFLINSNIKTNSNLIQALYVGEEPTLNNISYLELKAATDYIKETVPSIPVMIVEGYNFINTLQVPTTVDWVGFDHYLIKDPNNSIVFHKELKSLKEKRSSLSQKIVLVMDANYIEKYHTDLAHISKDDMLGVATSYYTLAKNDKDVVGLFGYVWPSGFDDSTAIGARHLPQNVKDEYVRIGKLITGK